MVAFLLCTRVVTQFCVHKSLTYYWYICRLCTTATLTNVHRYEKVAFESVLSIYLPFIGETVTGRPQLYLRFYCLYAGLVRAY